MSREVCYRISEKGAELVRIRAEGTVELLDYADTLPPAPPQWRAGVVRVRRNIGDPFVNEFLYAEGLPEIGVPGSAVITLSGGCYRWNGSSWERFELRFSDLYLRNLIELQGTAKASIRCIDDLTASVDLKKYLVSSAVQGMAFPSLESLTGYYESMKKALKAEADRESGGGSGRLVRVSRGPVGGVWQ
jgi:hypothetical protein